MYIGPWQEYRLAKIQDDAIQRIRQEWEDNIRAQLPAGDDSRIRELMQPLMAKLPALLMAKKSSEAIEGSGATTASRKARRPLGPPSRQSTRPSTATSVASSAHSRVDHATASEQTQNNQESHESGPSRFRLGKLPSGNPTKKPKKTGVSGAQKSALEEVERRKRMFTKWKKAQQDDDSAGLTPTTATATEMPVAAEATTRLPTIYPTIAHARTDCVVATHTHTPSEPTRLPSLLIGDVSSPEPSEPKAPSPREEPNLEDSLDEDEVNLLLDWTDTLLSPNALETSLAGLDIDSDFG